MPSTVVVMAPIMPDVEHARGCLRMKGIVGVVLAAGRGTRLRPLTRLRPKALCPVGNVPLVDLALERVRPAVDEVAVNLHHGRRTLDLHLADDVHRSVEAKGPLGTAGALGHLRTWIDGRDTLVVNADAWCPGSLAPFVDGWDGKRIRLLVPGADELGPDSAIAGALMPWSDVAVLDPEPSGLYEVSWRHAAEDGRVEVVRHDGLFIDCGTPREYLAANLQASGGVSVVEPGAIVEGKLDRCVVWSDARVYEGETLSCCIRARSRVTVLAR
jgi:N-acetyl-alpha-D-muramate 1-phosphate uridylyltransferase